MPDLPKIVYFGSDAICLPGLAYLFEQGRGVCTLAGVVTQPDRRQGRGKKLRQNPVAEYASSEGIPLLQPDKPDAALADWLRGEGIAVAFVMAYGHFLPKAVREAPKHGMLNFHGSILPAYRGASPVETAIALGEDETGVCLMQVVKEMDAGDVADSERVPVEAIDTSVEIRAKVGQAVVPLLRRNLQASVRGELRFVAQDAGRATFCRKIIKEDGALDFAQAASLLDARRRAFTPWPGAYFDHGDIRIKVGACSIAATAASSPPGTILAVGDTVDIATGDGVLRLHELQRPGGRMLSVPDFLRGYQIQAGELLSSAVNAPLLVRA